MDTDLSIQFRAVTGATQRDQIQLRNACGSDEFYEQVMRTSIRRCRAADTRARLAAELDAAWANELAGTDWA